MRLRPSRPWLACVTSLLPALLLAPAPPGHAGEGDGGRGNAPAENSSYVPDDDETTRQTTKEVDAAIQAGDWGAAARGLQRLVEGPPSAVTATGDLGVFEGVARHAQHRVLRHGPALLDAYEGEVGARARDLLAAGVARRDPALLERAVDLYLPSRAARRAALLLVDLGLEAGDVDGALGHLERLEDLEEVADPSLAAFLREAGPPRRDRLARALARDEEARARVREALERGVAPALADLAPTPTPRDWTTTGGGPSRAGVAGPLPEDLRFQGLVPMRPRGAPGSSDEEGKGRAARPSPWLPPRAAVQGDRAYLCDGQVLRVVDVATQRPLRAPVALRPGAVAGEPEGEAGLEARRRWGWIEGHGLTVAGDVVYVTVAAEGRDADGGGAAPRPWPRGEHVLAIRLGEGRSSEGRARRLWVVGEDAPAPGLPEGLRPQGTPLLYRGTLHVAGLRPTAATRDRFEAWHVALDPATGAVRSATLLGAGGPIRRGRADELVPTSCAGARGRVVLCTSLGVAAAVDARTGRIQWSLRYDRGRPDGDDVSRRLTDERETSDRASSFVNQPPRLWSDRCVLAPTDARTLRVLFDRPRGPARRLHAWALHRTEGFRNMAAESVAGVFEGDERTPPCLVVVGQGYVTDVLTDPHTCVAGLDPATGVTRWERALPFGSEPEPFGEALVTTKEVLVPTARGIARFALADGADRPSLDASAADPGKRAGLDEEESLFGNLVPVPGRGLVATNAFDAVVWLAR